MTTSEWRASGYFEGMTSHPHPLTLRPAILALAIFFAAAPIRAQHRPALSAVEQKVVQAVDARNGEALALLERLVNINSGTHNFDGVRRIVTAIPSRDAPHASACA